MSGAPANPLSRAKIRQLLAAVGSTPAPAPPTTDVADYDWRDPHYFNEEQLNRLAAVLSHAAALVGERFAHFYKREFQVRPQSITQHFADDLRDAVAFDGVYCLAFGPANHPPCGFLMVPAESVVRWVTRLLGDSESNGDPQRSLSSLELSLLSDLLTAVLEAFLAPIGATGPLKPTGEISEGQPTIQFERTEAVCRITFQVRQADGDDESDLLFLLPCRSLAPLVGKTAVARPQVPAQELSQTLMEHLQEMPVTITATLASATLSFEEIADLGPGDILLLDKPVEGSLELTIDGRTMFRGRPAQTAGRYATLITGCPPARTADVDVPDRGNHATKG